METLIQTQNLHVSKYHKKKNNFDHFSISFPFHSLGTQKIIRLPLCLLAIIFLQTEKRWICQNFRIYCDCCANSVSSLPQSCLWVHATFQTIWWNSSLPDFLPIFWWNQFLESGKHLGMFHKVGYSGKKLHDAWK